MLEDRIINILHKLNVTENFDRINVRLYDQNYTYNEIIYSLYHKKVVYYKKHNSINVRSIHIRKGRTWFEDIGGSKLPVIDWGVWKKINLNNTSVHNTILNCIKIEY